MRHFNFLSEQDDESLFFVVPEEFDSTTDKTLLSSSLGATLYIPATRPDLLKDLRKMRKKDATSVVICLEDSIPDERVEEAEQNLHELLVKLVDVDHSDLPLIFVRPRSPEHFHKIANMNKGLLGVLTGFVFPKFEALTSRAISFVTLLKKVNHAENLHLYYMPVLEDPSIIYKETREEALRKVAEVIRKSKDLMLAVRIGATDMSSTYGLRRSRDFTVYDVHVVSSAIADIVNVLGRDESKNIITGAVWEHFATTDRTFKPTLRESIFAQDKKLRSRLLTQGYDMFIKEIQLDKLNGITGKTVIHPSHIGIVHSLLVVTHEEYCDALDVLQEDTKTGGAYASQYRNKMNEVKPHTAWALKTLNRARMFGVSNEGIEFVDFLERLENE